MIKNWRPISLLNVCLKILSNALSEKLKDFLPNLISLQQTTYAKNRHIGESERPISDIIETAKLNNREGFLVAMDIEKAFEFLDHMFLVSILKNMVLVKTLFLG